MAGKIPYKRVLLKLSGEKLMAPGGYGISHTACHEAALFIKDLRNHNVEVAVVVGGGNFFRGGHEADAMGLSRASADTIGMLATLMNGIALQQTLMKEGVETCVMSALECPKAVESYRWEKAAQHLSHGKVVICVGGTGSPFFTTDTASALRACELKCDVLLKGTKVDGVYDKDPVKYADAVRYPEITFSQVLAKKLAIMDATAIAMCREHNIPIFVFKMVPEESLSSILAHSRGTVVKQG